MLAWKLQEKKLSFLLFSFPIFLLYFLHCFFPSFCLVFAELNCARQFLLCDEHFTNIMTVV